MVCLANKSCLVHAFPRVMPFFCDVFVASRFRVQIASFTPWQISGALSLAWGVPSPNQLDL